MGSKSIETRTHNRLRSLVGQRIAIHAGLTWDKTAVWKTAWDYITPEEANAACGEFKEIKGAVVCTAMVIGHRKLTAEDSRAALIDCGSTERWGLLLDNIERLETPAPAKGKQGIWEWTP